MIVREVSTLSLDIGAGFDNGNGDNNVFVGNEAGSNNESGDHNTYVGDGAGSGNYTLEGTVSGSVSGSGSITFDVDTKTFTGTGSGIHTGAPSGSFFIYNSGRNTGRCDYTITTINPTTYTISGSTDGELPEGTATFSFSGATISGSGSQNFQWREKCCSWIH